MKKAKLFCYGCVERTWHCVIFRRSFFLWELLENKKVDLFNLFRMKPNGFGMISLR